ncbi:MAG: FecR domain-containing protein, partial [Gemmatimonas sp.]
MANDPSINDILLERYLAGVASDDERAQVAAWLKADPARAAFLEHVRNAFTATGKIPDTDASWLQLQARMAASTGTRSLREVRDKRVQRSTVRPTASRWQQTAWKAAAAIVLVAGAASLWKLGANRSQAGTVSGALAFEAPLGQSANTTLPDGTKLTLAPGSRAEWSSSYGQSAREVTLRGEGFFDVVHDASRPFRVRARDGVAEDVGTRFMVRAWPELDRLEVAVEEGIVSLSDSTRARRVAGTLLHAGQNGRLASDGTVQVRPHSGAAFAWMR